MVTSLRIALIPPLWAKVAPGTAGGVEYMVHLLADGLVARGHEVTVFTSRDSPTKASLVSLCDYNMIEAMERGLAWEYEYYEMSNIAKALTCSSNFDVIHMHVGAYAIPLGELSRAPVLHTLHNPVTRDAIWQLERNPDAHVTAVGHRQIAEIPERRRKSIPVIHNACDFAAFEFSPGPGRYLAFLGRMGPEKAPHLAIEIARQAGWPIVLAGMPLDDSERAYFAEKVQPLVDGQNVACIGPVNDLQKSAFLRDAAALLFPLQGEEAFGLVMIEAMACGTPVIAWHRSSVAEVVDGGKTGYYGDSIEELVKLVPNALALDRFLVRQVAQTRYSSERMVEEYLEAYCTVLNAGDRNPHTNSSPKGVRRTQCAS